MKGCMKIAMVLFCGELWANLLDSFATSVIPGNGEPESIPIDLILPEDGLDL